MTDRLFILIAYNFGVISFIYFVYMFLQILKNIKERYSELRSIEQHLLKEQVQGSFVSLNLLETASLFCGDCDIHELQYLQKHDFPFINQSTLLSEQKLTGK